MSNRSRGLLLCHNNAPMTNMILNRLQNMMVGRKTTIATKKQSVVTSCKKLQFPPFHKVYQWHTNVQNKK